jgi:transcription antitermination protein NusB
VPGKNPSRRQARRDAAFVLYQHDVTSISVEDLLADLRRSEGYAAAPFTVTAVEGVVAREGALDGVLDAHSEHWRMARIAPLERNILRLALFEIEAGEIPPEVAIDEAVRLVKRYSTNEAASLVNGILGGVVSDRRLDDDAQTDDGPEE